MPLNNAQRVAAYRNRKAARYKALEAAVARYEAALTVIAANSVAEPLCAGFAQKALEGEPE